MLTVEAPSGPKDLLVGHGVCKSLSKVGRPGALGGHSSHRAREAGQQQQEPEMIFSCSSRKSVFQTSHAEGEVNRSVLFSSIDDEGRILCHFPQRKGLSSKHCVTRWGRRISIYFIFPLTPLLLFAGCTFFSCLSFFPVDLGWAVLDPWGVPWDEAFLKSPRR